VEDKKVQGGKVILRFVLANGEVRFHLDKYQRRR
jgi:hypothetical protein